MYSNSKIAKAVRVAMMFGAGAAAAISAPAFSAEADEAEVEKVERIEVTGSRIRRADVEGANPVSVMTAIDIEKFGITSIGDVLQSIPSAGSAINTNSNNGGNGSTTLNIRGVGSNRTLVLINGRRLATTLGGSVDLNNIPSSIIERIEVLKDGASAVYGSDAVAGVVNIITRKDFEGVHASAYKGQYDEGDGVKESYDLGFGVSGDKGNVYFNVSYVKEEATFAGDRDISSVPVFGTDEGYSGSSGTPLGRFMFFDEDGGFNNNTTDGSGNLAPWVEPSSRFNYAPFNYLSTPQERVNLYTQANYELSDNIRVNAEVMYGNRKSSQALAPTPLFFGSAFGDTGFTISQNNPWNPTGIELTTDSAIGTPGNLYLVGRRMFEAGFRQFNQDVDHFQFNGGLEGEFELGDRAFYWDASYVYSRTQQNSITDGLLNMDRVKNAIGDPADCSAPCTPLNLFGGSTGIGEGTITQEMLDYVSFTAQDALESELKGYSLNLSGDLFALPAGMSGFATGWEKRWVSGADQPDALIAAGITSGNARQPTEGKYSVEELFLELAIPLVADAPMMQSVDLELAVRYSDYSNFGDTTNSKIGLKWRVNDELLFRGTWSEAFRAPSISELFLGNSDSYPALNDPCNGGGNGAPGCAGVPAGYQQANSQIRITVGGNKNLEPEEAETFTYGLVYSPEWAEGLSLTFDVFDIEIAHAVSSTGAQKILDTCATTGTTFCSLVERTSGGSVSDLFNGLVNLGGQTTSGFDTEIDYNFETEFGDFNIGMDLTYVDERSIIDVDPETNTSVTENLAGRAFDRDVVPRIRSNINVSWNKDDWSANYLVRYIGKTVENCEFGDDSDSADVLYEDKLCSNPGVSVFDTDGDLESKESTNELKAMAYHDVSVTYFISDDIKVSAGVNNLWDTNPRTSYSTFANSFDPSMYEIPGRFPYVRISTKF
jgi:iron complex outermembrane receptor protein